MDICYSPKQFEDKAVPEKDLFEWTIPYFFLNLPIFIQQAGEMKMNEFDFIKV